MPASAVRPASAGNQIRAAPQRPSRIFHGRSAGVTLSRHRLPRVRKLCPRSKWTDRNAVGIMRWLLVSDLASTCGNRHAAAYQALTRARSRSSAASGRPSGDRTAMTRHEEYPRRERESGRRRGRLYGASGAFQSSPEAVGSADPALPLVAGKVRRDTPPALPLREHCRPDRNPGG